MSIRTKLVALNLALIVAIAMLAARGRDMWNRAKAERRATVNVPVRYVAPPAIPASKPPEGTLAAKYTEVATKDLLSKDRNPNVVIEPPKVEPPKVVPPLPLVSGVMTLPSGSRAIMAEKAGAPVKSVKAGETVGEFTVVAMDAKKITFQWQDRKIEKNLDDLVDRTAAGQSGETAGPAVPGPTASNSVLQTATSAVLGADITFQDAPAKACKPGDNSPAGTVVEGYRKTGVEMPFGLASCHWVPVK